MDNAFENIISNVNPVTPIADEWGQTRSNCAPFPFGQAYIDQIRAATQEARKVHPDAISAGQWEAALLTLKQQLAHARVK